MATSKVTVDVTPDLSRLTAAARIIARHMTALADELDALAPAANVMVDHEKWAADHD